LGAALQYICILQDGLAYGLSPQQAVPSPCQGVDGPTALSVSKNGFIMCDGERMFVESCPGGTVWDDVNKACVWPDMQTPPQQDQQSYSYGQQRTLVNWPVPQQPKIIQSSYGSQITPPQQYQQPKFIQSSYSAPMTPPQLDLPKSIQSSYSAPINIPQQLDQSQYGQSYSTPPPPTPPQPKVLQSYQSYDAPTPPPPPPQPKVLQSYQSYDAPMPPPPPPPQPKVLPSYQSYGAPMTPPPPPVQSRFFQLPVQQYQQPKVIQSYGAQQQQDQVVSGQQSSSY